MDNQPPATPEPQPKKFPVRTIILISVLTVIAALLIIFALRMSPSQTTTPSQTSNNAQIQPTQSVEKTATITFSPSSLDLTTSSSATVDIIATAGNTPITGVQTYIKFDPTVIRNMRVLPPDNTTSLFGPSASYLNLFNDVDAETGMIEYAIGIQAGGNPVVGTGSIGKLSFTVVRGTPNTQITFADGTAVTVSNAQDSVLNTTTPLSITLQ